MLKASFNFQAISLTICDKCRTVLHNNDRPNWDGRDDDGIPCPEGVYKGTIEIILQDLSAVGANFEFELRK